MPNCDSDDGNLGVAIVSNTSNGDTLVMCGPCLIAWSVSTVEQAGLVVTNPNDEAPDEAPGDQAGDVEPSAAAEVGQLDGVPVIVIDPDPPVTSEMARGWLQDQAARNVAAHKLEPSDSPAEGSAADQPAGGDGSDLVSTPAGELPNKPPF